MAGIIPVILVVAAAGLTIVGVPEVLLTSVHPAVPEVGEFATRVVLVAAHNVWSAPITATVGAFVTTRLDDFILLQPTPEGAASHSICASVGAAASGSVASGSVQSVGRRIAEVTFIDPPAGTVATVPVMV